MQRAMIIGQPGSGKSTFARHLGAATGLPVVHIDKIHWKSGWIERTGPEKDTLCAAEHAKPRWIFEGGRSTTWGERLHRADTLIWLDLPLALRSWRVLKRTLRYYGQTRPDLPPGCPERFSPDFYRFIWNTRHTSAALMQRTFDAAPANKSKHRLKSPKEIRAYLKTQKS